MIYHVLVRGENFVVRMDGVEKLVGFFKTIAVECETVEEIEMAAVNAIRSSPELLKLSVKRDSGPQPRIFVDEIYPDNGKPVIGGFTWYGIVG